MSLGDGFNTSPCVLLAPSALPLPPLSLPWIFFQISSALAWKNWILLPKALFPPELCCCLEPRVLAVALGVTAMPTGPKNSRDLGPGQSLGCLPKPWQPPPGTQGQGSGDALDAFPIQEPPMGLNWDLGHPAASQPLEGLFLAPEQGLHRRKRTFSTQEGLPSHLIPFPHSACPQLFPPKLCVFALNYFALHQYFSAPSLSPSTSV